MGGKSSVAGISNVVKLSSNENPFGPSEAAKEAFRKAGFEERHFARYDAFEFEGTHPFASIRDSAGCALMDMSLT